MVSYLLDQGAVIDQPGAAPGGTLRRSALQLACVKGHLEVVKLLIHKGADPTSRDPHHLMSSLLHASQNGHAQVVRFLLENKAVAATIDVPCREGCTALWWACLRGHGEVTEALLEGGADPKVTCMSGITPQDIARHRGQHQCMALIEVS